MNNEKMMLQSRSSEFGYIRLVDDTVEEIQIHKI